MTLTPQPQENEIQPLPTMRYGHFCQALQRRKLPDLAWQNRQMIVAMHDAATNVCVSATDDTFQAFTLSIPNTSELGTKAQQKITGYVARHKQGNPEFWALQLDHVLKEIAQIPANRKSVTPPDRSGASGHVHAQAVQTRPSSPDHVPFR